MSDRDPTGMALGPASIATGSPMVSTSDKIVTGAPLIAKYLDVSPITVIRMVRDGRLAAWKTGKRTSPLKCWLSDIERVRRAEDGQ